MSKMSRTKGAAAEREAINILKAHGWVHAERSSNGRVQFARGDVIGGPAGCHIEIKRAEKLSVPAALDQAMRDAPPTDVPIIVHRPSRHVWMATLPLEELLPLLRLREVG